MRSLVSLIGCALAQLFALGFAQSPVVWLPPASADMQQQSQPKQQASLSKSSPAVQHAILNALYARHILSPQDHTYRQVKIKLMDQDAASPYALVYLYSNSLLSFTAARVDLSADDHVLKVHEHYALQDKDFVKPHAAQTPCPNAALSAQALLFFPDYQAPPGEGTPCSAAGQAYSYLNQKICSIASEFEKHYPSKQLVTLLGEQASSGNFANYMSCPSLHSIMVMSSEYVEPHPYLQKNILAGTAFWTNDPSRPVTSDNFKDKATRLKVLHTEIIVGGHLFSNNSPDGMCPTLTSNTVPQVDTYASAATSLDIPGAAATYECIIQHTRLATDRIAQKVVDACASQHDPYIKDNQSNKMYIANLLSKPVTLQSGGLPPVKVPPNTTVEVDTQGNTNNQLLGPGGTPCIDNDNGSPNASINKVSQGVFTVTHHPAKNDCVVWNNVVDLPIQERPFSPHGSGVLFKTWNESRCLAVRTGLTYFIRDQSGGQCPLGGVTFDFSGTFDKQDPNNILYGPVQEAAKGQNAPDNIKFAGVAADQPAALITGYYYTGSWLFTIDPASVHGLPANCTLTVDRTQQRYINDLTATPTTIPINVSLKTPSLRGMQ